jgi:hypothetical protein
MPTRTCVFKEHGFLHWRRVPSHKPRHCQPESLFCRGRKRVYGMPLNKSIYGLKQVSKRWYLKFDETIRKFGFKENEEENCVYAKFKNGKFIFLILYVDDILLASSDFSLLLEKKKFLSSNFDMKNLGEASY